MSTAEQLPSIVNTKETNRKDDDFVTNKDLKIAIMEFEREIDTKFYDMKDFIKEKFIAIDRDLLWMRLIGAAILAGIIWPYIERTLK